MKEAYPSSVPSESISEKNEKVLLSHLKRKMKIAAKLVVLLLREDKPSVKSYNLKLAFTRTRTLMEGDEL